MKSDGWLFLYTDFYNGWGCYSEVMLEICPTLQNILDVDGKCGESMKMVDGATSMGMMSVVEMVISYHSFLYVWYYFSFWILKFL